MTPKTSLVDFLGMNENFLSFWESELFILIKVKASTGMGLTQWGLLTQIAIGGMGQDWFK